MKTPVHDSLHTSSSRHVSPSGQVRLGITGGIGSGKSYVARMLQEQWGVPVYDCDAEAKRITVESHSIREALTSLVGDRLWRQGHLQKSVLADYLFASQEHAEQVNAIIHPAVRRDFLRWADRHGAFPLVGLESAILCESGFHSLVDSIMLVDAPLQVRLERAMNRDGATRVQVEARMASQDTALARSMARFVVSNDGGTRESLLARLQAVMAALGRGFSLGQDNKKQTYI